jgi:predicted lipase
VKHIDIFLHPQQWQTIGDDTQYLIKETDDEFIIAFYGSNSDADWKTNFNFFKKPYKNMEVPFHVHRGFLKVWKLINDFFLDLVKDVEKPITIVGHSYGAAVATLCMEDIWFNYPKKRDTLKLVTFGSPRVIGWYNYRKIKERWNNSSIYENRLDLVTHVPFAFMGFRHVQKITKIGRDKPFLQRLRIINNHMIPAYEQALRDYFQDKS